MYKLLVVLAIGFYAYKFLSNKDVFILVEGKKNFNASVLKTLHRSTSVYEIKSNAYERMDDNNNDNKTRDDVGNWNYAVIARKFADDNAVEEYVSLIRHFDFVEDMKVVTTLVGNYEFLVNGYNFFQRLWARVGGALGFIPTRPFQRMTDSPRKCQPEDATNENEIHTISLWKIVDQSEMRLYKNFFLWKVIPAFGIRVDYNGKPESSYWNNLVVFEYERYADFCELITSELFETFVQHKYNAVADSVAYIVKSL